MAHAHQHGDGHHHASGSRNLRIAFFFNLAFPVGSEETVVTDAMHIMPHVYLPHEPHAWSLHDGYIVSIVSPVVTNTDAAVRSIITQDARKALTDLGVHHATIELELPGDECSLEHH